jgi:GAF domain-containing protein
VAVAHNKAGEEGKLHQLQEHYPATLAAKHGGTRVFQTGKSEMCCEVTEEVLQEMFEYEKDRSLIRELQPTSYIAVPLRARDRVLGAITMVNTTAARSCGADELSLAEELAQRAALALDNAGLYKAAQEARTEAERANLAKDRFLAMLSHELRTPLMPVLTSLLGLEHEADVPETIRPALQMIRRNVELEARLIDDLLDLTGSAKARCSSASSSWTRTGSCGMRWRFARRRSTRSISRSRSISRRSGSSSPRIRRGCSRFFGT